MMAKTRPYRESGRADSCRRPIYLHTLYRLWMEFDMADRLTIIHVGSCVSTPYTTNDEVHETHSAGHVVL